MIKTYGVHDHWTDIAKKNDVDIESIDGVITGIKVNGEDYGGGSSDFSTAEVTLNGGGGLLSGISIRLIYVDDHVNALVYNDSDTVLTNGTYITPLYKGTGFASISLEDNYVVTGNATVDEEGYITITGNFTVTKP